MDYRFGPVLDNAGVTVRLYAPSAARPKLLLRDRKPIALAEAGEGFWSARVEDIGEGTRYRFRSDGIDFPDLASRQQDGDNSGWSVVRRPLSPAQRTRPIRPWHEAIIAEVHVGMASPEGTFDGLRDRLPYFRDAGYTCLEIMPVNAFPGERNWGYDGTLAFAPAAAYGSPDQLRTLVDSAHDLGLSLLLDVVYNHFGDTNDYARHYLPEWFSPEVKTPWGPGVNFENPFVRQFYYENAVMWLREYDFDGLRFDAVHEMKTSGRDVFLRELAAHARETKPDARLVIENIKNSFEWLEREPADNKPLHYSAQWNDDMHHVLTYLVTGEGKPTGYDDPAKDPYADLEKALANGFVHDPTEGEDSDGRTRGGAGAKLPPDSFITYVQNHDQIGNRADSKRISERVSPEQTDFMHFVKFLAPQVPLCFMGDEANLDSPFPFFFDLPADDARKKRDDRYDQMKNIFNQEVGDGDLPEPGELDTFLSAKLPLEDVANRPERSEALEQFRQLASWRRERLWPLAATPCLDARTARQGNSIIVTWEFSAGSISMALNPTASPADLACQVDRDYVSTGWISLHGEVLRLGPWSAVSW